jgi:hypothetical protein
MRKNIDELYSDNELIERIWDKEEIKDLLSRRTYCRAAFDHRKELDTLWVTEAKYRESASYANNSGFFTGMDSIYRYYVMEFHETRMSYLKAYAEADPQVEYSEANLNYGSTFMTTLNTPNICISDDGRFAQFMGYECYRRADGKPDHTTADFFGFDLVYADLVKQADGSWKIWHLISGHDISIPVGVNTVGLPYISDASWDPVAAEYGKPDIQRPVYDGFRGWEMVYYDMPRDFVTYDPLHSYGPEGNVGYKYYQRKGERI